MVKTGTGASVNVTIPAGGQLVTCAFDVAAPTPPTPPTATDDTATTPLNTPVSLPGSTNDTAGSAPIDDSETVFTSASATDGGKTLVTVEGTWTVDSDGSVLFTPAAGYTGTTAAVQYKTIDEDGESDVATLAVTVKPGLPTATPDTDTTPQATPITLTVLTNDTAGIGTTLTPGSVVFNPATAPADSTISNGGKTLTVPGEGVYTIKASGQMQFTPVATFTGTATTIGYTVTDAVINTVASTVTITVTPLPPTAIADTAGTPYNTAVTLPGSTNDTPSAVGEIDDSVTVLTSSAATASGTKLVTADGTWKVNADGTITFTPADGYVGTTPAIGYRITDVNGQHSTASVTVTVRPGPLAEPDSARTAQNVTVTLDVLGNDTPGRNAGGTAGTWDLGTVRFPVTGQPTDAVVSGGGTVLTVPGEGVYTAKPTGTVAFDPEPGFTGGTSTVTYAVTDNHGNTAESTITVSVAPLTPVANDDAATTAYGVPVTLPAMTDDVAGVDDGGTPADTTDDTTAALDPARTVFPVTGQSAGAVITGGGATLTVPGQGAWHVNADGSVTFTPAAGFSGTTTPVGYLIGDVNGTTDRATLVVTVRPGPTVVDDTATTPQNVSVDLTPLGNDTPGLKADGSSGEWDRATLTFPTAGQPAGATVTGGGTVVSVPGEGVYTINANGTVTFDPEASFTGAAKPIAYEVTDIIGTTVSADLRITVTPVSPIAKPDTGVTPSGTPVKVDVLANDTPGSAQAVLVPGSLTLIDPVSGDPVATLKVSGEGTWKVDGGQVQFTPEPGFHGDTTPISYQVADTNGTTTQSTVEVTVKAPGVPVPGKATAVPGQPATINVLGLVTPTPGATLIPGSVCLLPGTLTVDGVAVGSGTECVAEYTRERVGTWVVNPDGTVTFTPADGFDGVAVINYQVKDNQGSSYVEKLTFDVAAVRATKPVDSALPDTGGPNRLLPGLALGMLLAGAVLVLRSRRKPLARHRG